MYLSTLCFSSSPLTNDYSDYEEGFPFPNGVTDYVSHTNVSIRVRIQEEGDRCPAAVLGWAPDQVHCGVGYFWAKGDGDLAFYRIMDQCMSGMNNPMGFFDCQNTPPRKWIRD